MENERIKKHAVAMLDMGESEMRFNNPTGAAYALGAYEAYRVMYEESTGINLNKMKRISKVHSKLSEYVSEHDAL